MENPQNSALRAVRFAIFGIAIGFIPGMIRVQQLDRQLIAEREDWTKTNEGLRAAIVEEKDKHKADKLSCENAILGDGARTILVDRNHPYGPPAWNMFGVSIVLPPPGAQVNVSPIWVIPRAVTPHVVDGILGGVYTHIWPNGRTDGWQMPSRAE